MAVSVHRGALSLDKLRLPQLVGAARKGNVVFNPDERRLQRRLPKRSALMRRLVPVLRQLGLTERRTVGPAVLMHSLPGCRRQQWHTDYDPDTLERAEGGALPMGVLVALQPDTLFHTPTKKYRLSAGDVLCFDASVVHAGAAYRKENTRVHVYLEVDAVSRQRNRTWLV